MATDFAQAMREKARELTIRGTITFASGVQIALTGEAIMRYALREGVSDGVLPGAVLSASHTLELANAQGEWLAGGAKLGGQVLSGATVQLELGVRLDGGGWAYSPLGLFVVSEASGEEGGTRIALTGSDSIAGELYAQFSDDLRYPATLEAVWRHAVAQTRYAWNGTVPNGSAVIGKKPDWKGGSVRQVMAAVAMAAGCFVRVSRDGALELVKCFDAGASVAEIDAETYLEMTHKARGFGPVQALTIAPVRDAGNEEDPAEITVRTAASVAAGVDNTVRIENNPLFIGGASGLNALAQGTLDQLAGMVLREADFRWRGDPGIRIGDRVKITDRRGNVTETVVLRQTLVFGGGFSAEIGCDVADTNRSGVPRAITPEGGVNAQALVGTVNGGLLAAESVTARSIAAGTVTAEKIAAGAIGAEKIEAGAVTAEKLDAETVDAHLIAAVTAHLNEVIADGITTDELYAAIAEIAQLDVEQLKVDGAQIIDATIVGAKIADAAITSAKIGDAAVGTAQIALGAITAALIKTGAVGTAQIADGSITDAKIVALTADKINAGTLSVERLLLKGAGGLFYEINAQAGGLTSAQLTEEQYQNAISGTALAARSVTADKIAAKSLTANEIAAGTITAAEIDVAKFFAAEGVINSLQAVDISGNESLRLYVKDRTVNWSDVPPDAPGQGCQWGDTGVKPAVVRRWRGLDLPADRETEAVQAGNPVELDNTEEWMESADIAASFDVQVSGGTIRTLENVTVTAESESGTQTLSCDLGGPACEAAVDFAAGTCRQEWEYLELDGTENWQGYRAPSGNWMAWLRPDPPAAYTPAAETGNAICNALTPVAADQLPNAAGGGITTVYNDPIVITMQPADVSVPVGSVLAFSVAAQGEGLTYQWQWSGANGQWFASGLSTANTAVLNVPATADRHNQHYRCVITDVNGNRAISGSGTLTIIEGAEPAVLITGNPASQTQRLGTTFVFFVAARGEGLTYQWQWQGADAGDWWGNSGLSTANTAALNVPATADRHGQNYRCVVTDANGNTVASAAAKLHIGEKTGAEADIMLSIPGVAYKTHFAEYLADQVAYRLAQPAEHAFAPQKMEILPGRNVLQTNADELTATVHGSGWETVNDQSGLRQYAETRFEQTEEQIRLRVMTGELELYLRMEADGVHIGRVGDMYSARINGTSFDILAGGGVVASFRDGQIRLGTYDFRETSDTGMAFTKWRA